jgi:hypothetical protein
MHFQASGYLPALRDMISLRDKMHPGLQDASRFGCRPDERAPWSGCALGQGYFVIIFLRQAA